MKKLLKFGQLVDQLPSVVKDAVLAFAKDEGINEVDTLDVKRQGTSATPTLEKGERAEITYVTSRRFDRDAEVVVPEGGIVTQFKRAPQVLWGHNYGLPPIGHDEWLEKDEFGWKAKTIYVETRDPSLANVVWDTIAHGSLKTSSMGFIPLQSVAPGHKDWDRVVRRLTSQWKEFDEKIAAQVRRIITKWLLLEHSKVSVPANIDAATIAVAKAAGADSMILHDLGWDADGILKSTEDDPSGDEPDEGKSEGDEGAASSPRDVSVVPPRDVTVVERQVEPVSTQDVVREVLDLERGRV